MSFLRDLSESESSFFSESTLVAEISSSFLFFVELILREIGSFRNLDLLSSISPITLVKPSENEEILSKLQYANLYIAGYSLE